jgi:SAM-dependent methyltransferase
LSSDRVEANRAAWDKYADTYQEQHAEQLDRSGGDAWGVWQIPESELNALGEVEGKDVLELGCGAAQWSIAVARRGARPVGIDLSAKQLEYGRTAVAQAGLDIELLEASADELPFDDASFDLVFCDHGAMNFADPLNVVPEVARVLRPGGLFVFSHASPFYELFWDMENDAIVEDLRNDYFGMHATQDPNDGMWGFNLPHGEWVKLFRSSGLLIEDLIELRPAEDATSSYDFAPLEWARRWPAEEIWRVRKA